MLIFKPVQCFTLHNHLPIIRRKLLFLQKKHIIVFFSMEKSWKIIFFPNFWWRVVVNCDWRMPLEYMVSDWAVIRAPFGEGKRRWQKLIASFRSKMKKGLNSFMLFTSFKILKPRKYQKFEVKKLAGRFQFFLLNFVTLRIFFQLIYLSIFF